MATQAYTDWVKQGKPFRLARPVLEYRSCFVDAGWPVGSLGTIGDYAHLTAERPQDHTPFSYTGWPNPNPYPYVHAFDAGHLPSQGFDMAPVVRRWLQDARDGKTPWVKYIVWRGQSFDVRRDWEPAGASGHYDHAHVSIRTDWFDRSIGDYNPAKKGTAMSTSDVGRDVWAETISSPGLDYTESAGEWLKWTLSTDRKVDQVLSVLEAQSATVATLLDRLSVPLDAEKLAALLGSNPAFVDALAANLAGRIGKPVPADLLAAALHEASIILSGQ